jgi:uncharacterized protein YciI
MKRFIYILFICNSCSVFSQTNPGQVKTPYNAELAKQLGADDYGMKHYVIAFLRTGKKQVKDSTERMNLQMAHLKNISRLADMGKLIVAGPFLDEQAVEGIFIFNVSSLEEAKKLTDTDPAIQAGTLEMELRPWYGSAALMETVKLHKSIQKKKFTE